MTPLRQGNAAVDFYAIDAPEIYAKKPHFVGECVDCGWKREALTRRKVRSQAVTHIEEAGHTVCIRAVRYEYLTSRPATTHNANRRVRA